MNHPLAEALLAQAKKRELPSAEIHFDYGQHEGKVTPLESLIGKSGWPTLTLFSVESLDQAEDHLIIAAETDQGQPLDEEVAARLLMLPGKSARLPTGEGHHSPLSLWEKAGVRAAVLHSDSTPASNSAKPLSSAIFPNAMHACSKPRPISLTAGPMT